MKLFSFLDAHFLFHVYLRMYFVHNEHESNSATKSGTFILPKKLESQVEKHTQYLSCQVPSKYAGKIYLKKNDLPKEVPLKFFRINKHPKNRPSYFVGNKLVYKTEPNWIWWDSGKIVRVENVRKK